MSYDDSVENGDRHTPIDPYAERGPNTLCACGHALNYDGDGYGGTFSSAVDGSEYCEPAADPIMDPAAVRGMFASFGWSVTPPR